MLSHVLPKGGQLFQSFLMNRGAGLRHMDRRGVPPIRAVHSHFRAQTLGRTFLPSGSFA